LTEIEHAIRPQDDHFPVTRLVCLENSHNLCGAFFFCGDQFPCRRFYSRFVCVCVCVFTYVHSHTHTHTHTHRWHSTASGLHRQGRRPPPHRQSQTICVYMYVYGYIYIYIHVGETLPADPFHLYTHIHVCVVFHTKATSIG